MVSFEEALVTFAEHGAQKRDLPEHGAPEHGAPEHSAPKRRSGDAQWGLTALGLVGGAIVGLGMLLVPCVATSQLLDVFGSVAHAAPHERAAMLDDGIAGAIAWGLSVGCIVAAVGRDGPRAFVLVGATVAQTARRGRYSPGCRP